MFNPLLYNMAMYLVSNKLKSPGSGQNLKEIYITDLTVRGSNPGTHDREATELTT